MLSGLNNKTGQEFHKTLFFFVCFHKILGNKTNLSGLPVEWEAQGACQPYLETISETTLLPAAEWATWWPRFEAPQVWPKLLLQEFNFAHPCTKAYVTRNAGFLSSSRILGFVGFFFLILVCLKQYLRLLRPRGICKVHSAINIISLSFFLVQLWVAASSRFYCIKRWAHVGVMG